MFDQIRFDNLNYLDDSKLGFVFSMFMHRFNLMGMNLLQNYEEMFFHNNPSFQYNNIL